MKRRMRIENELSYTLKFEDEINKLIIEALSVSSETAQLTEEVYRYLKANLYRSINKVDTNAEYKDIYDVLRDIKKFNLTTKIEEFTFRFELTILNLEEIPHKREEEIILKYLRCKCITMNSEKRVYAIKGILPLINMKMTWEIKGVLAHELRHSWIHSNRIDDTIVRQSTWKKVYEKALETIVDIKNERYNETLDKETLYKICSAIYISDTDEIGAFTQQLYDNRRNKRSQARIEKVIRGSQLYKLTKNLSKVILMFETENVEPYLKFFGVSKGWLLSIFRRRYEKCKANIAKMMVIYKNLIECYIQASDFWVEDFYKFDHFNEKPIYENIRKEKEGYCRV